MSSLSVTLSRGRVVLLVAPSILVLLAGPSSMALSSMVAFPVKFRLYLHLLVDVLAVVDVLAAQVLLDVYESGLYRQESRLVPVVLVVPALGVAVPWSLLLVLVVVLGAAVP